MQNGKDLKVTDADQCSEEERIWAYLHDELSAAERDAVDHVIASDPELAHRMTASRRLDASLRELLPVADETDEQLVHRIAQSLDTPGGIAIAPAPEDRKPHLGLLRPRHRNSGHGLRYWPWNMLLAAAALLLICLGVFTHFPGPIAADRIDYRPLQYRQADSPRPVYSRPDANRCGSQLAAAIESAYRKRTDMLRFSRPQWDLQVVFAELAGNRFTIQLEARRSKDAETAWTESRSFSSMQSFERVHEEWAQDVAATLTSLENPQGRARHANN